MEPRSFRLQQHRNSGGSEAGGVLSRRRVEREGSSRDSSPEGRKKGFNWHKKICPSFSSRGSRVDHHREEDLEEERGRDFDASSSSRCCTCPSSCPFINTATVNWKLFGGVFVSWIVTIAFSGKLLFSPKQRREMDSSLSLLSSSLRSL